MGLCNGNTKRLNPQDIQLEVSKIYIVPENLAGCVGFRGKHCWVYVSIFENTPEKLILKSIFHLKVAATFQSSLKKGTVGT